METRAGESSATNVVGSSLIMQMTDALRNLKISEYRAAAAGCIKWAEAEGINEATRLRWRKLADQWTQFAEELEHMQDGDRNS